MTQTKFGVADLGRLHNPFGLHWIQINYLKRNQSMQSSRHSLNNRPEYHFHYQQCVFEHFLWNSPSGTASAPDLFVVGKWLKSERCLSAEELHHRMQYIESTFQSRFRHWVCMQIAETTVIKDKTKIKTIDLFVCADTPHRCNVGLGITHLNLMRLTFS